MTPAQQQAFEEGLQELITRLAFAAGFAQSCEEKQEDVAEVAFTGLSLSELREHLWLWDIPESLKSLQALQYLETHNTPLDEHVFLRTTYNTSPPEAMSYAA